MEELDDAPWEGYNIDSVDGIAGDGSFGSGGEATKYALLGGALLVVVGGESGEKGGFAEGVGVLTSRGSVEDGLDGKEAKQLPAERHRDARAARRALPVGIVWLWARG